MPPRVYDAKIIRSRETFNKRAGQVVCFDAKWIGSNGRSVCREALAVDSPEPMLTIPDGDGRIFANLESG